MRVLFTAIGRRVELIEHFKKNNYVVGVDSSDFIASKYYVDKFYQIKDIDNYRYIDDIIFICERENIDIIIPLYEKEFLILDENRSKLEGIGTYLLLSDRNALDICLDKKKTYSYLKNITMMPKRINSFDIRESNYPMIAKPVEGMGSRGIFILKNYEDYKLLDVEDGNYVFEEYISGQEYTVDILLNKDNDPISIVPRKRIEVRAGEVSKSIIEKNSRLIEECKKICKKFKQDRIGLIGPINIQFIKNKNEYYLIEINPRFGGGVPLTLSSGVNYADIIKKNYLEDLKVSYQNEFIEKFMIRYDRAVYGELYD